VPHAHDPAAENIAILRAELADARRLLAEARDQMNAQGRELDRITRERDDAVRALEFERTRLVALLKKAPALVAVVRGPTHVFEFANEAFCELSGRPVVVGKPLVEVFPEIESQGFIQLLDRVFATGEPFIAKRIPARVTTRPGAAPVQFYANLMYHPVVEADGTTTGVFIHAVDVTEETTAEQRIRDQFDHVPMPTHVWQRVDHNGSARFVLVDFNAAELELSRGGIAKHLGEPAHEFFANNAEVLDDLNRCLDSRMKIQREIERTMRTTGEPRRLRVNYGAAPPDRVVVHTEDITERRQLEDQLRHAQKMEAVGRLAGGVAHDFNNLLSVILSYTEMYLEELKPEDPFRADLEEIHKAAMRAVGLTRQLLAFSRKQILQPRAVDLTRTVGGLATMLQRLLGENIELSLHTTPEARDVWADPGQLEQVIVNLAVNARDAMPTGGKLTIEVAGVDLDDKFSATHFNIKPGQYVMLALSDTGVGMDEATRSRIFEPFFTTKAPEKGTGLGLAMVFAIVEQSGGSIWVYSELGRGTTFKIYLPRAKHASETGEIPVVTSSPLGGNETILLVEDDDAVRALVRTILRRNNYNVLEAQNGGEAFLVSEQFPGPIHLLLTDVIMPRMSGRQIAERLSPLRKDMKVLYMSGYTDDAIVIHGVLESSMAFLQKPITSDALLRKVREVLDTPMPRALASQSG
jgi:signal transduction histidine kinase/ActR/RegA family two-component response regulator/PAS domain-containing protein